MCWFCVPVCVSPEWPFDAAYTWVRPTSSGRPFSFQRRITCDKCVAAKRLTHLVLELTPAGMAGGGVWVCLSDRRTNTYAQRTDAHCVKSSCTRYIRRHSAVQQHMGAAAEPLGQQLLMLRELTDSIFCWRLEEVWGGGWEEEGHHLLFPNYSFGHVPLALPRPALIYISWLGVLVLTGKLESQDTLICFLHSKWVCDCVCVCLFVSW